MLRPVAGRTPMTAQRASVKDVAQLAEKSPSGRCPTCSTGPNRSPRRRGPKSSRRWPSSTSTATRPPVSCGRAQALHGRRDRDGRGQQPVLHRARPRHRGPARGRRPHPDPVLVRRRPPPRAAVPAALRRAGRPRRPGHPDGLHHAATRRPAPARHPVGADGLPQRPAHLRRRRPRLGRTPGVQPPARAGPPADPVPRRPVRPSADAAPPPWRRRGRPGRRARPGRGHPGREPAEPHLERGPAGHDRGARVPGHHAHRRVHDERHRRPRRHAGTQGAWHDDSRGHGRGRLRRPLLRRRVDDTAGSVRQPMRQPGWAAADRCSPSTRTRCSSRS